MFSTLKKNNVKLIDGKLWAAILKDINDPNFISKPEAEAIFNARQLQGAVLLVRLQCDDDKASDISSIDFYYTHVNRVQ